MHSDPGTKARSARQIQRAHPAWGWLCVGLGLYPISIALGLITVDESRVHAPMWVMALSGIVFVICGCMILLGRDSRLNNLFAALMTLSFAAIGVWVSLFSPPEGFSGGIPLLSNETNVMIARWVFGCGAIVSFALCGYAVRQLLNR